MRKVSVLIPTYNRHHALAVTLTSLCFQDYTDFDVIVSDQSEKDCHDASLETVIRLLRNKGHSVRLFRNLPPRGMAQQRQFLLELSQSPFSLFLDDDLILESYVIRNLLKVLEEERCGFVGNAVIGLSYVDNVRPDQQHIEFWNERVRPEAVVPGGGKWDRHKLHNAANLYHVQMKMNVSPEHPLKYKVAWIGGCVMYDTIKLKEAGGFGFWRELPVKHCGEDVLVQLRVARLFGGCGLIPSGAYHQELQTTVPDREINAPEYLSI
ncbi:MAG TPA: glycosyltransferase family A protein [Gammaproteobacteria bacterium]|jgi:glycosyltransferase involved in cell wall biosynthesis